MMNTINPVHFAAKKAPVNTLAGKEWNLMNGAMNSGSKVIQTDAEWKAFWQGQGGEVEKGFDPKKHTAVVISLGGRSSSGYGVNVISARETDGKFHVQFSEITPGGGIALCVMTNPVLVKLFPKTDKPVVVTKVVNTGDTW
jgi:hypothetical protein